jgi:meso-butanediol dehydrogenase/(S,S)-butanediol dehydrogenase/diacetyl reductase
MSKVIVITGAGVGLGRALARAFIEDGHSVALLGRTAAKVEAVAEELGDRAMAVGCDVASPESVRTAFAAIAEKHQRVDVLINNAAIFEPFKVVDASDEQIFSAVTTNVAGPMLCAREAIPLMGRGAHIINVSSESIELPFPHLSVYRSTKAAVERFSNCLMIELDPEGIRVTTVRAGAMHEAATKAGINLIERPITQFTSLTGLFQTLVDLPEDLQVAHVGLHARAPQ